VTVSLAHIGVLTAQQHGIQQLCIVGNYTNGHEYLLDCFDFGTKFHSRDSIE
jgi:pantothenate kinase